MFQRTSTSLKYRQGLRQFHSPSSSRPSGQRALPRGDGILAASAVLAATAIWLSSRNIVHGDSVVQEPVCKVALPVRTLSGETSAVILDAVAWGSNKSNLISPDAADVDSIRTPAVVSWLTNVALRDLALHQTHAACIDVRGDVYQWGDGYFGFSSGVEGGRKPSLTLQGKNIVQLQLTESRLFALSASGKVYVLSTEAAKQALGAGVPTPASSAWWGTGFLWGEEETIDFAEITPNSTLGWGEKFTSISAGHNHLLALTSAGRTFAYPINKNANAYGQLGFRNFDILDRSASVPKAAPRLAVELVPKSIIDPLAKATPYKRTLLSPSPSSSNLVGVEDNDIRFCDKLFEIPSLKGVNAAQIATGGRSSFIRTSSGQVLGWGANEYGQIGLGDNVTLDTITVPTEVILWRTASGRTGTKCTNVEAGGDLTCFTVERSSDSSASSVDVLMCGNGQWGGLGNNVYSNAQGSPVRARNVSGLQEYSERTKSLQAILPHAVSVSPTGHVLLTLDTAAQAGTGGGGRDLVVWGANRDYELGNGKKSSMPVPTVIGTPEGQRFMLRRQKAREVKDLKGKVWKRGVEVEQCAVAGYGSSFVYWRIR